MMTRLVNIEDAGARLASGDAPYAFETSDNTMIVGPASKFGKDYLRHLRTQGRYAETIEEATQIVHDRGAEITGIWFVKE